MQCVSNFLITILVINWDWQCSGMCLFIADRVPRTIGGFWLFFSLISRVSIFYRPQRICPPKPSLVLRATSGHSTYPWKNGEVVLYIATLESKKAVTKAQAAEEVRPRGENHYQYVGSKGANSRPVCLRPACTVLEARGWIE